jgi:hypothetical protein
VRGHPQPTPQAMAAGGRLCGGVVSKIATSTLRALGARHAAAAERAAPMATRASSRPMELLGALAAIRMMDRRDGAEVRGQMPAAKGGRIGCFDAHHKASDAPTLERLPLQSTSQADLPARGADRIRSILYSFLSFFSKTPCSLAKTAKVIEPSDSQ